MTTTVVKTIGSTGDYSLPQTWEDATPANLVTADQIWQGQLQNQAFSAGVSVAGTTTDATRYVELTTVAGSSFSDNASVQSNALRFNTANGASISVAGGYASAVDNQVANTRLTKLQLESTAGSSQCLGSTVAVLVDRCIMESAASGVGVFSVGVTVGSAVFKNSLFVNRAAAATKIVQAGGNFEAYNCTFAVPSDKTAATNGLDGHYSTATVKNCAIFGATNTLETGNSTFTNTTCRTDQASPPSGFTQIAYDTSTGSGFQNITDATRDYRLKSTSAMLDVGTTDSTNAAVDIAGTSRPSGSAYDIGAWEYVAAAADVLMGQACL